MKKLTKPRFAVIDLGSNTFHLLIAEQNEAGGIDKVFRDRQYVKLASGGSQDISNEAFRRGIECLTQFKTQLEIYHVKQTKIIGTAMLRTAKNASLFIEQVHTLLALDIEVIDGFREAEYIRRGVKFIIPANLYKSSLILDIGGGSVECIINSKIASVFSKSFPIGIAILKKLYHHSDPITVDQLSGLNKFIGHHLQEVRILLREHQVDTIIGCSGSFEVLAVMQEFDLDSWHELNIDFARDELEEIIKSSHQMRLGHAMIPKARTDLIVVASALINWFLELDNIKTLVYCPFALKEGVLLNLMNE